MSWRFLFEGEKCELGGVADARCGHWLMEHRLLFEEGDDTRIDIVACADHLELAGGNHLGEDWLRFAEFFDHILDVFQHGIFERREIPSCDKKQRFKLIQISWITTTIKGAWSLPGFGRF